jgi:putative thioredoxin
MGFDLQDFDRQVLQRSHEVPVVVDFWAPWCGPCKTLGPVIERLAAGAGGRWELVKVNTEENQQLAMTFDIRSIPAVKLFVDGEVKDEFLGALPEAEIRRWIDKNLPSPHAAQVEEARKLAEAGDWTGARERLADVVQAEPGNEDARLLLAEALLRIDPAGVAAVVDFIDVTSDSFEKAEALRALAGIAILSDNPQQLPDAPVRERFLSGCQAVRAGDWASALAAFIEVLERRKDYAEGRAREGCRAIFQYLGFRHPVAEPFHRAFSSALHS